jgi:hypothetical protein
MPENKQFFYEIIREATGKVIPPMPVVVLASNAFHTTSSWKEKLTLPVVMLILNCSRRQNLKMKSVALEWNFLNLISTKSSQWKIIYSILNPVALPSIIQKTSLSPYEKCIVS